jgi:2-polyprenyl-3-methyl-5-hydroxy-6-metoxy-1,4-benzoquinol methylase
MSDSESLPKRRRLYGERPGWGDDFDYDEGRHLVAYRFAASLACDKRVLDAGCGEGFGTQTLADVAREVVGVDYSDDAIDSARGNWHRANLSFRVEDLTAAPSEATAFDLVLSFQVIEHIADEMPYLRGLCSRVAPGGTLIITTPNILMSFSENPFHVREYRAEEFEALLRRVFGSVEIRGVHGNDKVRAFDRGRKAAVERILRLDPLGLRKLIPQRLVDVLFARLGQLVRRQARKNAGTSRIGPEDFRVTDEGIDQAVDLVAICRP